MMQEATLRQTRSQESKAPVREDCASTRIAEIIVTRMLYIPIIEIVTHTYPENTRSTKFFRPVNDCIVFDGKGEFVELCGAESSST